MVGNDTPDLVWVFDHASQEIIGKRLFDDPRFFRVESLFPEGLSVSPFAIKIAY